MIENGRTFKLPLIWTCAKNTTNSRYKSCNTPQETPTSQNYSQAQLIALSYQRDLCREKKIREITSPELARKLIAASKPKLPKSTSHITKEDRDPPSNTPGQSV